MGGKYVSPSVAEQLAFMVGSKTPSPDTLSPRELQVMLMLASGKSLTEIAEEMALSIKTVCTYRTRILEKMNMKNNRELILYAAKHGLTTVP